MIPGGPDNIVVLSVVLYYSPSDATLTFGDVDIHQMWCNVNKTDKAYIVVLLYCKSELNTYIRVMDIDL